MIQQEIFGPVITVQQFSDEAEAIALRANGHPLRARLLGLDARRRAPHAMRVANALRAFGCVWVN